MTKSRKRTRRQFSPEFKADAIRLVLEEQLPIARVARDLGIGRNSLTGWLEKHKAEHSGAGQGALTAKEREELRRLRRENKVLREERDILKKATAFFAKESR